ncbi:MAG: tetratricopeptide repeat protein, partial [Methanomicrobiales archaeon]|nr:tetratricopeptide repeat protein [Methanomicrobiales archaeon]
MPSPSSENKVSLQYSDVFNQAEVLRLSGSFDKSIEYFKRCLAAAIQAGSKKEQMQSLIKLGILSWNVGLLGESATYYLSASIIAHSLGLIKTEEDCKKAIQIYNLYNAAKDYRDKEGDFQKSIDTFKKAIILSRDINSPEHELKCLRQTSVNFFNLAEFQEFHALNLEALMIAQKINNWKDEGICLNNIGLYFWKIDNYSYALQHYEKALEIAQKINNVESEADILTNISICYADLGNFEKSIELLLKVLEMDRRMNLSKQIPLDLNNIGIAYRRKALLTENDEDYIKALRYFEDSLKLARESLKGTEIQIKTEIRTLHNIGSVYSLQNKNDKALIYFDEAYN